MKTTSKDEILAAENSAWSELHSLIDELTPVEAERPGYYVEGWSAKDALSHVGAWLAEAGMMLERIGSGTYSAEDIDIDETNAKFLASMKDIPFNDATAQASAARTRMLQALRDLPDVTPDALWWVSKSGPEHYAQHVPRMREWIQQMRS
jgi:mycothiol maleylpyruvate isomerase-like protein